MYSVTCTIPRHVFVQINIIDFCSLLPAATKLGQGNIFTSVCQEFCPRGGGIHPPDQAPPDQAPPDQAPPGPGPPGPGPPGTRPPRPQIRHPPREADCSIRSTSGRYASYWNAFLLNIYIVAFLFKE